MNDDVDALYHQELKTKYQWAVIIEPAARNPDVLPDPAPSHGCEVCGAAYAEIEAVAYPADTRHRAAVQPDGTVMLSGEIPIAYVRLICTEGHDTDHPIHGAPWALSYGAMALTAALLLPMYVKAYVAGRLAK